MTKKTKQLILLCATLVLLAVAYLLVSALTAEEDSTAGEELTGNTYYVCTVNQNTVCKISYTVGGVEYAFTLNEDATAWLWDGDTALPLNNLYFANMVTSCGSLTSTVRLTDVPADRLAEYGLGESAIRLSFTDEVSGTRTYLVGALNSYNGLRYFCEEGNTSTVYMVDGAVTDAFVYTPYDMIALPDLPTDITAANLVRVTLTPADSTLSPAVYTYYPGGKTEDETDVWYVSMGGEEQLLDTALGDALSTALTTLAFSDLISYRADEQPAFGLDAPTVMTVDYKVTQSFRDETTGKTTNVNVDRSFSLLLGDIADNGLCFATVEDSVLTCSLMGEVFSEMLRDCTAAQNP